MNDIVYIKPHKAVSERVLILLQGWMVKEDTYLVHVVKGSFRKGIKGTRNRCPCTINQHVNLPSHGLDGATERISQGRNPFRNVLRDQDDKRGREVGRERGIELALCLLKLGHGAGEEDELCTLA